jgi:hypothetical protein
MRSESDLRSASGYAARPRDFDDLIGILDAELRLITPTDPDGSGDEAQPAKEGERYYQLTHDYLVHSLREWLSRKQRETRRGRAELLLAERAAIWDSKPETRHLPSLREWVTIRMLTPAKDWTDPQKRMMRRAGRVHGMRALAAALLVALLSWGAVEAYGNFRASNLVESLGAASIGEVPAIVLRVPGYRRWVEPELRSAIATVTDSSQAKLNFSLALLPTDSSRLPFLESKLQTASPSELPVLRAALSSHRAVLTPKLWSALERAGTGDARLLPISGALAVYDPVGPAWEAAAKKVASPISARGSESSGRCGNV